MLVGISEELQAIVVGLLFHCIAAKSKLGGRLRGLMPEIEFFGPESWKLAHSGSGSGCRFYSWYCHVKCPEQRMSSSLIVTRSLSVLPWLTMYANTAPLLICLMSDAMSCVGSNGVLVCWVLAAMSIGVGCPHFPLLEDSCEERSKSAVRHSYEEFDELYLVSGAEFVFCNLDECQICIFFHVG